MNCRISLSLNKCCDISTTTLYSRNDEFFQLQTNSLSLMQKQTHDRFGHIHRNQNKSIAFPNLKTQLFCFLQTTRTQTKGLQLLDLVMMIRFSKSHAVTVIYFICCWLSYLISNSYGQTADPNEYQIECFTNFTEPPPNRDHWIEMCQHEFNDSGVLATVDTSDPTRSSALKTELDLHFDYHEQTVPFEKCLIGLIGVEIDNETSIAVWEDGVTQYNESQFFDLEVCVICKHLQYIYI